MEHLNLVELLKDCPKGMELYSPIFGNVKLEKVFNNFIYVFDSDELIATFDKKGKYKGIENGECQLFPSKDQRDWSKFQRPFKAGDIVATEDGLWIGITEGGKSECFIPTYCVINGDGEIEAYFGKKEKWLFNRLATEEEKQKLFDAIKDNGYKWNPETKTLEKLVEPKFKVGDRIRHKEETRWTCTISRVEDRYYVYGHPICYTLPFGKQNEYELVPNKFDITTLKVFDKVLVRGNVGQKWTHDFFGFMDKDKGHPFVCVGHYVTKCIPYEGNEHLLGTTNDCDDFYKTW